ncbi:histidine kinase dimerization/phosphoacceptor domain -containing protein [Pelagibius sp. 7325]|uniref:sensor histidine kinase n=1 Tax=Pelagibius sp. 7325 TaxID=3131994 RepID=UPI0030ECFAF2
MLRSLRSRLIVLLALALLPASTLAIIQAVSYYRQVTALTERNLLQSSAIIAAEEKNVIVDARRILENLATLREISAFTPGACGQTLLRTQKEAVAYSLLVVLRPDGTVACSTDLDSPATFANEDWFTRTVANDGFTVSGNVELPGGSGPTLMTTLPLHAPEGPLIGMVGLALNQAWLGHLVSRPDGGPSLANTSVALLDQRGAVLAESAVGSPARDWMPAAFVVGTRLSGQAQVFRTQGRDGIERIFALAPLYEQQVFVVMGGVSGHLLANPSFHLVAGLAYPVLMWSIAIAVAWFAVERLVLKQVLRLRKTANAYAEGHFEARTPGIEHAPQEIRELGMTMHKMADVISLHESELRKSLQEQKALLREVYHRVKNNLQVVSSLVNLQVSRARNEHERGALRTTQDRIHALSMVHSNLYETPELHQIKLQEFVPQLCEYLRQAQGDAAESVRMTFDIDTIQSDPERAVPLALLITEVVTNALKHGWPEGEPGRLAVALKQVGEDGLEMTITDDGSTAESASPESLGGRLIHAFAKQLGGSVTIENGNGFHLTLQVPSSAAPSSLS